VGTERREKAQANPFRRYGWVLAGVWTLVVAASLVWNLLLEKHELLRLAHSIAQNSFDKDILYRRWAANHGGVYVTVDPGTPPNPYFSHVPERDLKTPGGRDLTLMNPAYMTRQVYDMAQKEGRPQGHITSLNPLRPENAPDAWEREALVAFQRGETEVSEVEEMEGKIYYRLMRPFYVEASCLKCHAEQGYKVGDLRGGVSVVVPMAPLLEKLWNSRLALGFGHFSLWLLGLAGIVLGVGKLDQEVRERIKAQETVAAATTAMQTIDGMMDSVVLTDLAGQITHHNQALTRFFGWGGADLLGELPTKMVSPPDVPKTLAAIKECLEKGYKQDLECRLLTRDGREIPVLINATLMKDPDGNATGTIEVIRDITALRQAEEALRDSEKKLRFLTSQILTAQEKERSRLAKDLHDDLGQSLLVLKMQVRAFEKHLREDQEPLIHDCEYTVKYIDEVIENVRRLSRDLSPALLAELGLALALKRLLEDFGKFQGLRTYLEMDEVLDSFPPEAQIVIYRIFQELLTNIGKHAEATEISVAIKSLGHKVSFQVEDNGRGFDQGRLRDGAEPDRGLGLTALDERVRMLGGVLEISSREGQGTMTRFTIPLVRVT